MFIPIGPQRNPPPLFYSWSDLGSLQQPASCHTSSVSLTLGPSLSVTHPLSSSAPSTTLLHCCPVKRSSYPGEKWSWWWCVVLTSCWPNESFVSTQGPLCTFHTTQSWLMFSCTSSSKSLFKHVKDDCGALQSYTQLVYFTNQTLTCRTWNIVWCPATTNPSKAKTKALDFSFTLDESLLQFSCLGRHKEGQRNMCKTV